LGVKRLRLIAKLVDKSDLIGFNGNAMKNKKLIFECENGQDWAEVRQCPDGSLRYCYGTEDGIDNFSFEFSLFSEVGNLFKPLFAAFCRKTETRELPEKPFLADFLVD
jgi:hypothetical protein